MRCSSLISPRLTKSIGFTLVEMLVITPIVMLALGGFIALMVTMVGDVLATRDQSTMTYESQDTLSRIESDIKLSVRFLTTTGTLLSPQGSDSNATGTAAFTNTANTLILYTLATDKKPEDQTRQIVYYNEDPNGCGADKIFNQVYLVKTIYFIKNGSLWRRSAMPVYNTNATPDSETLCSEPWQKDSCSLGYTNTARCKVNDMELMKNVSSLNVEYFTLPDSFADIGAANAAIASTVKVTINGSKLAAGRTISTNQSTRATRINAPVQPPMQESLRFKTQPFSQSVLQETTNVQFTATPSLSRATVQWSRSTDNGATWSNISGATNPTYTLATVSTSMSGYRYRATATTVEGSITSQEATLTVSIWGAIELAQNWSKFDTNYADAGYMKTSAGIVILKGKIKKSSSTTTSEIIGTLPVGYRPNTTLIFSIARSTDISGAISILANGNIVATSVSGTYTALDNIRFVASDAGYTYNALTPLNGWLNTGGIYGPAEYVFDSQGRVFVQGVVKSGTNADPTAIVSPSIAAHRPAERYHYPTLNSTGFDALGADSRAGYLGIVSIGGSTVDFSITSSYDPSITSGWTNLTFQNSWIRYGSGSLPVPQYTKDADGLVSIKGIVSSGSLTSGNVISSLPAGYCPNERLTMATLANYGYGQLEIAPTASGCDIVYIKGSNTWFSLTPIKYLAEK